MKLSGKVALVLPGTFGVGYDAAVRFAAEGAAVVAAGLDAENGRKTVDAIRRAGGEGEFVRCDLLSDPDIEAAVALAVTRFGGLDVAFGCPDYYVNGILTDQTTETFDETLRYNCRSLFFLSKYAIPRMEARAGGSLIFLTSMYASVTGSASCAYEVAKGSVVSLARNLADVYGQKRIRVNCIATGHLIEPPRGLREELPSPSVRTEGEIVRLSAYYPTGRLALPDEVASAAAFLASDDAAYANGSTLSLDGGFICR